MKRRAILISVLLLTAVGFLGTARASSGSGTMAVSVTVASTINLVFTTDASGLALTNSGSSAVTASFGTMSAYGGTTPTGVTEVLNGTSSWTISTPFDVVVTLTNQTSPNYTLTAQLNVVDPTNTWKINTTTIIYGTPATLTSTGSYGSTSNTLNLTIPFSENAGTISDTINFVATAN